MAHVVTKDTLIIATDDRVLQLSREDAAAVVAFGQAGAEEKARLQRVSNCTHNVRDVLNVAGDTCCRGCGLVQKGEAGVAAAPAPPMSERVIGPGADDYGRKMAMNPVLGAPYGSEQKPVAMAHVHGGMRPLEDPMPLTCAQVVARMGGGRWVTGEHRLDMQLGHVDSHGWHSFTWPDRAYVRVIRGRAVVKVGDGMFVHTPTTGGSYIPPLQKFMITGEDNDTELCIDWHHATAPAQVPRDKAEVEATNAAAASGREAAARMPKDEQKECCCGHDFSGQGGPGAEHSHTICPIHGVGAKQRLADAIMKYLGDRIAETESAATKNYTKEGKTSKTMGLDDRADLVTDIHDAINRIINQTT